MQTSSELIKKKYPTVLGRFVNLRQNKEMHLTFFINRTLTKHVPEYSSITQTFLLWSTPGHSSSETTFAAPYCKIPPTGPSAQLEDDKWMNFNCYYKINRSTSLCPLL